MSSIISSTQLIREIAITGLRNKQTHGYPQFPHTSLKWVPEMLFKNPILKRGCNLCHPSPGVKRKDKYAWIYHTFVYKFSSTRNEAWLLGTSMCVSVIQFSYYRGVQSHHPSFSRVIIRPQETGYIALSCGVRCISISWTVYAWSMSVTDGRTEFLCAKTVSGKVVRPI